MFSGVIVQVSFKKFRYLSFALLLACGAMAFVQAPALAQGYTGLVAPADDSDDSADDSYGGGIVAPRANTKPAPIPTTPPTVKPGEKLESARGRTVPKGPYTPATQTPQQSDIYPVTPGRGKNETVADLKKRAEEFSRDRNNDGIPDALEDSFKLPDHVKSMLALPRPRVDGMLPMEAAMAKSITTQMTQIRESKLPPKVRANQIKLFKQGLEAMRTSMVVQLSAPEDLLKKMGIPENYIKEDRASMKNTLTRIDAALDEIEKTK